MLGCWVGAGWCWAGWVDKEMGCCWEVGCLWRSSDWKGWARRPGLQEGGVSQSGGPTWALREGVPSGSCSGGARSSSSSSTNAVSRQRLSRPACLPACLPAALVEMITKKKKENEDQRLISSKLHVSSPLPPTHTPTHACPLSRPSCDP